MNWTPSRPDAAAKIRGTAPYTADSLPAGTLHVAVVRSTVARGRVTHLDLDFARSMPEVVAVIGPADVPSALFGDVEPDEPVLASDDVRYLGQPIALVAAETRLAADRAAAHVSVEYERLPPVVTLESAIAADAPQVRAGQPNILEPSRLSRGDVKGAFARGDVVVVETTVRTQRANQGYIELRAALAELDHEGRLVITATTQAPFQVRAALARLFDLPLHGVLVRVPAFGGGFGGKLHAGMAPYAAAVTMITRRPSLVICPRDADLQASNPRESSIVTMRSAVTHDGIVVGREVTGYFDSGAYVVDTPYITSMGALQATGPYSIDAVSCAIHAVSTNLQPTGSFRSPSGPQMAFANERHMDDIARRLGKDRLQLRRANFMVDGSRGPTGQFLVSPPIEECLDAVERQLDAWRAQAAEEPSREGVVQGFASACSWWFTAPGSSSLSVRLEVDGGITVMTGATEIGTGAVVSGVRNLVADAFGVEPMSVRVVTGSTDLPEDFGSEGSRTLYGSGNAALSAAAQLRAVLAESMEVSPHDLELRDGHVGVVGDPESLRPLGDVVADAQAASGGLIASGRFQASPVAYDPDTADSMLIPNFHEPTFHCQGAWVEVDRDLGQVRVRKYVAAHDVGAVIDPVGLIGQVQGGVVQGLGYALFEDVVTDAEGLTLNANLADYRMPTAGDVPEEIVVIPVTTRPSSEGPRGAKGIGEAPVILPAAVVAAAVEDATSLPLYQLPLVPARVVGMQR